MLRRFVPLALIFALLAAICPTPALAVSTSEEVQLGAEEDQQITASSVIETDPLLNAWVKGIAETLWKQVARKDVPYNVKIINDPQINAFSTLGGYVYVYEGMLDFVQSDDELASVIGHETGHIERRHTVTMQAKSQILNLIFSIASLFSPLIWRFGDIAEAGIMAKMSRIDELQADQYGLLLMSRAGYDPNGMISSMNHLGALQDEHSDLLTKYLEDHPDPKARVSHLLGYPEIDPTVVNERERVVWALHDMDEARYSIANRELQKIVQHDPNNEEALLALGQSQLALGQSQKSRQTLAQALQKATPQAKSLAQARINALTSMTGDRHVPLTHSNLSDLRLKMAQALKTQSDAIAQIGTRRKEGNDQIDAIQNRLNEISYEIPNLGNVNIRPGTRLDAVVRNITGMGRSINSALNDAGSTIGGVGWRNPKTGKLDGQLLMSNDILNHMQKALDAAPLAPDSMALFPSYPSVFGQLSAADADMLQATDAARASTMQLDLALGDLDAFLKRLDQTQLTYFGDISVMDYNDLLPLMQKADASLGAAAVSASQAAQLFNMAKSRQISAQITLLGVGTSPERYATLQKAINVRFNNASIGYDQMLQDDLSPGDIVAASIVAADTKTTPEAIINQAKATGRSIVDVANARGMHAEALEIFLGLIWYDYTDDPLKEAQPIAS